MEDANKPLLCERAVQWLLSRIRENTVPLAASLLAGFLAYTFSFTNKLLNHDEAFCLFSKGATVDSGRWGLGGIDIVFPNFSMPWIYGVLTILLMAVSVCVIIHIFEVRSRLFQALLAGCILVFPSLTGTFAYMFTASSFAVSFLLAVSAVWFARKPSIVWGIPALVCMVASLSIYQSYISVAAGLMVLVLIRRLLQEEEILPVIRQGVYFLLLLIVSLGLYYAATQVILQLKHVRFNAYADSNVSFSLSALPAGIARAYCSFFAFFSEGKAGLMPTVFSRWMHGIGIAAAGVMLVIWGTKHRQPGRLALLIVLTAILPLAVNCMYLFTVPESIHTLVLYGFICVYVLIILAADTCLPLSDSGRIWGLLRSIGLNAAAVSMAAVIMCNIYIANAAGLRLYLRYENTRSFYTALVADLQQTPGFDENTRLAVAGTYQEPEFYENFSFLQQLTGTAGIRPDSYSREKFLEYYLGFSIPFASEAEIAQIQASPEYEQMPVYPYYGSIQKIGDLLVVKLS
ncbi:MAG: glucosyltransferase domain-containing protein [Faecousia sp.]